MMGDEGLGKTELAAARRGDPRRLRARRHARGRTARASRCCATSCCAMADHHQRDGAAELAALVRNLATRLSEWCGEGTYAYLLDRETTVPADSPLVVFDTRRCPQDVLRPVMFSIMEYVTATVERHWARAHRQRPAGRRAAVRRTLDHAHRRGLARRARPRDRRIRQRPRAARPPPRAVPRRHASSSSPRPTPNTAWRCCRTPRCSCCSPSTRASSRSCSTRCSSPTRNASSSAACDRQGQPRPDAVDQRHAAAAAASPLRVGPTEYWAFTSDQGRDAPRREAALREHDGDAWAAISALAAQHRHRNRRRDRDERRHRPRTPPRRSARRAGPSCTAPPPAPTPRGAAAPLLAVCGVCGGAGTSTLSHLLARRAPRRQRPRAASPTPADPTGGLSARAGVRRAPDAARGRRAARARSRSRRATVGRRRRSAASSCG